MLLDKVLDIVYRNLVIKQENQVAFGRAILDKFMKTFKATS